MKPENRVFTSEKLKQFRDHRRFSKFDTLPDLVRNKLYDFAFSYLSTRKDWHNEWFSLSLGQQTDALIYLAFSLFVKKFSQKIDEHWMVEIMEDGHLQYSYLP